jgi:CheY-like chemotaxis protein
MDAKPNSVSILVIDDHEGICSFMRFVLEAEGYAVRTAADGAQGLKAHRALPADVVITDIFMPNQDGVETIAELRREFPAVRIIAMSGGGKVARHQDYLEAVHHIGVDRSLRKPFEASQLLEVVRDVLQLPPAPRPVS